MNTPQGREQRDPELNSRDRPNRSTHERVGGLLSCPCSQPPLPLPPEPSTHYSYFPPRAPRSPAFHRAASFRVIRTTPASSCPPTGWASPTGPATTRRCRWRAALTAAPTAAGCASSGFTRSSPAACAERASTAPRASRCGCARGGGREPRRQPSAGRSTVGRGAVRAGHPRGHILDPFPQSRVPPSRPRRHVYVDMSSTARCA